MTAVKPNTIRGTKSIHSTAPAPVTPTTGAAPSQERIAASAYEYPESRNVVRVVEAAAGRVRQKGESAFLEFEQKDSR